MWGVNRSIVAIQKSLIIEKSCSAIEQQGCLDFGGRMDGARERQRFVQAPFMSLDRAHTSHLFLATPQGRSAEDMRVRRRVAARDWKDHT